MLRLVDLLAATGIPLRNYKVHLATGVNTSPLHAFFEGTFQQWQERQNAKNFKCDQVLSLISLGGDKWLFAGVYKINGVKKGRNSPYLYQTQLIPGQRDLLGRVVVKYKRRFRSSYIWGHTYGQLLEVSEVRPERMAIEDFPGYTNVLVPHRVLKIVVDHSEASWRAALSSVKGVYLIIDTATGKSYIGSATADGGIWQRWSAYARTGHGGNFELKALLAKRGIGYADNFQYAVLETADSHASKEYIEAREAHWKDALLSREFGYNAN